MAEPTALAVAVDLAERRRDAARQRLAQALAQQQSAQGQLDQLQGYASDTNIRWGLQENTHRKPEILAHHYQFMDRLAHAIGLQADVMAQHARRIDEHRRQLLEAELRVTSLRKVVAQRAHETQRAQQRREQKQTDETAALQHRRQHHGDGPWG